MAKINDNGATEMARISTIDESGSCYLWVITSDGRVLRRRTDIHDTFIQVYNHWTGDRTQAVLCQMATESKQKVISLNLRMFSAAEISAQENKG